MPQCNASRMIERPPLRRHIRERGTLALHWLVLGNPALVEIAEASGAEGVVLDLQHGLWERAGLEAALRPIAGAPWRLVRLADHDRAGITTALDAGADGIIAPLVESAEQARNVVAAARFAPVGERSVGGGRPLAGRLHNHLRRGWGRGKPSPPHRNWISSSSELATSRWPWANSPPRGRGWPQRSTASLPPAGRLGSAAASIPTTARTREADRPRVSPSPS